MIFVVLMLTLVIGFLVFMWGYGVGRKTTIKMAQMIIDGTLPVTWHPDGAPKTAEELLQQVAQKKVVGERHINLD